MYYILDDLKIKKGLITIEEYEAKWYNSNNYGVFSSVNTFKDNIRKKENLLSIDAWAFEIDDGTKEEQMRTINSSPLKPSKIIETKRGYQVYFSAIDATVDTWYTIVEDRLIPFFKADRAVKDICRIFRVPGFYHCKDPNNKFLIQLVEENTLKYSELEMLTFFKDMKEKTVELFPKQKTIISEGSFWSRANTISSIEALEKLSGTEEVKGEHFDFTDNGNGTTQIYVDGKMTGNWIDIDGRIGSSSGGGPSIVNWLYYYWGEYYIVADILKKYFKEYLDE